MPQRKPPTWTGPPRCHPCFLHLNLASILPSAPKELAERQRSLPFWGSQSLQDQDQTLSLAFLSAFCDRSFLPVPLLLSSDSR